MMILSEKSSKKKADEEVMLLYSKRKPPKFHRIERALHFLRMSDEDLHKLARKISKTVHKLWFAGKFVAVDETIIPDLSQNLRSEIPKKKRKGEGLDLSLGNDRTLMLG